jgi:tripartite-type tricarboxylate transporter receptor subunit TctC
MISGNPLTRNVRARRPHSDLSPDCGERWHCRLDLSETISRMRLASPGANAGVVKMVRTLLAGLLCAWTLHGMGLASAQAQGEAFPNRPIRMIVPFPAGGPTDGMARIISDRLGEVLGQTIVVENRGGGAGGSIGAKVVASADPDGYTILITPGGALTTGPAVHSNIGYDPLKAFVPVASVMESPLVIAAHQDLPVKSLADVVAYAKANPGKIIWGSQGFGTAPHLLFELFKLETGVNVVHVPYRSLWNWVEAQRKPA